MIYCYVDSASIEARGDADDVVVYAWAQDAADKAEEAISE
jgi:hypothetical protein